jgi:LysM repeat protein
MPSATLLARAASGEPVHAALEQETVATSDDNEEEVVRVTHRVRTGETLFAIAKRYGTTIESLKALNNLRSSALKVGARLVVQTSRTTNAQQN